LLCCARYRGAAAAPRTGEQWPGLVIGWRGDRVDVTWTTGVGATRIGFVNASQIERV